MPGPSMCTTSLLALVETGPTGGSSLKLSRKVLNTIDAFEVGSS